MSVPPIFETCRPRSDVLSGAVTDADFAADLASVVAGRASAEYLDPVRFFADTYPTRGPEEPARQRMPAADGCGRRSRGDLPARYVLSWRQDPRTARVGPCGPWIGVRAEHRGVRRTVRAPEEPCPHRVRYRDLARAVQRRADPDSARRALGLPAEGAPHRRCPRPVDGVPDFVVQGGGGWTERCPRDVGSSCAQVCDVVPWCRSAASCKEVDNPESTLPRCFCYSACAGCQHRFFRDRGGMSFVRVLGLRLIGGGIRSYRSGIAVDRRPVARRARIRIGSVFCWTIDYERVVVGIRSGVSRTALRYMGMITDAGEDG